MSFQRRSFGRTFGDRIVTTPRGFVSQVRTKNGKITAVLTWYPNFGPKTTEKFNRAQAFVDSEVLRLSEPYTPLRTGTLVKTGILGTEIGSGWVRWIAPYARRQYYLKRRTGSATGPLRGPMWFERMKTAHKDVILRGAAKLTGGKPK